MQAEYEMIVKTLKKISVVSVTLLTTVFQGGCTGIPDGTQAVTGFELDRYLGTWY